MKRVSIVVAEMKDYRIKLYNLMKEKLSNEGVKLEVIYGQPTHLSGTFRELEWGVRVRNLYVKLFGKCVTFQPVVSLVRGTDLLVIVQENLLLTNYYFLCKGRKLAKKIAFWGHGTNFQSDEKSFANRVKKFFVNKVDWWFAYNDLSKRAIMGTGFPEEKITSLMNAKEFDIPDESESIFTESLLKDLRDSMGIEPDSRVGIFCGIFRKDRRMDFFLESLDKIKEKLPKFKMILIGDGPYTRIS